MNGSFYRPVSPHCSGQAKENNINIFSRDVSAQLPLCRFFNVVKLSFAGIPKLVG